MQLTNVSVNLAVKIDRPDKIGMNDRIDCHRFFVSFLQRLPRDLVIFIDEKERDGRAGRKLIFNVVARLGEKVNCSVGGLLRNVCSKRKPALIVALPIHRHRLNRAGTSR